jgi:phospholipase C
MDGFVRTPISHGSSVIQGAVGMGYWTGQDLPLTWALAETFPIADRWFCSCLAQTHPQRRFLIAGTAQGMTGDVGNPVATPLLGTPAKNGTIFTHMETAGISWADYNTTGLAGTTMNLYNNDGPFNKTNAPNISQFFSDARSGRLPQFSLLDPDFGTQSQENPQNISVGEGFLGQVIDALRDSPAWRKTLFILTYDEHGGYYDHVPPPRALAPDDIAPVVNPGEKQYDGFARYGFRVPSVVIGPYVKRHHVSHLVYDHTSILAFLEHKWNLPAMTRRDANAHNLLDFLDLDALKARRPTFPELPKLVPAGDNKHRLACQPGHAGTIPPRNTPATRLELRSARVSHRRRAIVVEVLSKGGRTPGVSVELRRGRRILAHHALGLVGPGGSRTLLRTHHGLPPAGHYEIVVRTNGLDAVTKRVEISRHS